MPNYDELEHEGTEDFAVFQNRKLDKEIKQEIKVKKEEAKEKRKNQLQDLWLSLDNPFVWEGDFDV